MNRVVVSNWFVNLFSMQVCAVKDATNKEILEVCNRENPAGTEGGWCKVIREIDEDQTKTFAITDKQLPFQCDDDENRLHFLVEC